MKAARIKLVVALLIIVSCFFAAGLSARVINSANYAQSFADAKFAAVATVTSGVTLPDDRFLYEISIESVLSQDGPTGTVSFCSFESLLIGKQILVSASALPDTATSCQQTHSTYTSHWIVMPLHAVEHSFDGPRSRFLSLSSDEVSRLGCRSDQILQRTSRSDPTWPSFFYSQRMVFFPLDDFLLCIEDSKLATDNDAEPASKPHVRTFRGPYGV